MRGGPRGENRLRFAAIYAETEGRITSTEMGRRLGVTRERARQLAKKTGLPLAIHGDLLRAEAARALVSDPTRSNLEIAALTGINAKIIGDVRRALGAVQPKRSEIHGTTAAYQAGCRCDECRAASAARMREYFHGNPEARRRHNQRTRKRQQEHPEKALEASRRWRQKALAEGRFAHGTERGYTVGCRCDACRNANAERARRYLKRRAGAA